MRDDETSDADALDELLERALLGEDVADAMAGLPEAARRAVQAAVDAHRALGSPRPATRPSTPLPPTAGQRIGPYRVVGELGRGGMGVVYRARRDDLGREVALKVIRPGTDADPDTVRRFQREAQAAARLAGRPGIVGVLDAGTDQGRAWFAMELIVGRPLDALIDAGDLTPPAAAALMAGVAEAVQSAHAEGILHRDLKPSNILVDAHDAPWVTDFGLARAIDDGDDATRLTRTGAVVGTPAYLSPEQARGQPLDGRSDVWALGATLYECLCGRPPFDGDSTLAVLAAIQRAEPRPLRAGVPDCPSELETICRQALEKDVARRYQTAGALATDLRAFLAGQPIAARPPTLGYRARKWAHRNRRALRAGVGVAATLGLGGAMLYGGVIRPRWRAEESARVAADAQAVAAREAEATHAAALARELALARAREAAQPHLDRGREALVRFERMLAREDSSKAAVLPLGREAQAALDRALAAHPDHPEVLLEMARLFRLLNQSDQARAWCARAIRAHPRFTPARLERALLILETLARVGPSTAGEAPARAASDPEGPRATARADLAVLQEASADASELEVAAGLVALLDGRWREAAERLEAIAKARVADPRAWGWAGAAWSDALDPGRAEAAFTEALRLRPWSVVYLRGRGVARQERGDLAGACADFDRSVEHEPGHWGTYVNRGQARFRQGDLDGARSDLERALQLAPDSVQALVSRGMVRHATADLAGAREDFDRALALNPRFAAAWFYRGTVRRAVGDLAGARADLDQAVALDPADARARLHRGEVRYQQGDLAGARADYDEALALHPNYADALRYRAWLHEATGDRRAALADLEAALKHAPADWPARAEIERLVAQVRDPPSAPR